MSEWDKLQEHFEQRTLHLRTEVDRLNKTLTDTKIKEQTKEAEFEQLLMGIKQKAAEQEVSNGMTAIGFAQIFWGLAGLTAKQIYNVN